MGYSTDLIGRIDIHPPLNDAEQEYLAAFARSRRCARADGPYAVPGNPAADDATSNAPAPGQPSRWCGWAPSWDGACLAHDGGEKFYQPAAWLAYLIEHFLRPGARASTSGLDQFHEFGFDHVLDGTIAACRRDTRELYLIRVEHNRVFEQTIVPPDPQWFDLPDLPYEEALDRQSADRHRQPHDV
jgi:hypothetical protein